MDDVYCLGVVPGSLAAVIRRAPTGLLPGTIGKLGSVLLYSLVCSVAVHIRIVLPPLSHSLHTIAVLVCMCALVMYDLTRPHIACGLKLVCPSVTSCGILQLDTRARVANEPVQLAVMLL